MLPLREQGIRLNRPLISENLPALLLHLIWKPELLQGKCSLQMKMNQWQWYGMECSPGMICISLPIKTACWENHLSNWERLPLSNLFFMLLFKIKGEKK